MDSFLSGALQAAPPHPAIRLFAQLVEHWAFTAGIDYEFEDHLSILTNASKLGVARARPVIKTLLKKALDLPDIQTKEPDRVDHTLSHAIDELRHKRLMLDLTDLRHLVDRFPCNTASRAVDMMAAHGTRAAFDSLFELYESTKDWHLRGLILRKFEVLAGRLSLVVFEADGKLSISNTQSALTAFPIRSDDLRG